MLADPFTIAASAPTPSLVFAVIRSDGYGSERLDTGGNPYSLLINHDKNRNGSRHYMKITQSVDAVSPYTGLTLKKAAFASLSIQRPDFGFSDGDMIALVKALTDTLADSEVTTARLLQFQS